MSSAEIVRGCACGSPRCDCARARRRTHCPAPGHRDRRPSLDVDDRGGHVVFICRAGCSQQDVVEGLRQRGLWTSSQASRAVARRSASPLEAARRQILHEARLQSWARDGVQWLYGVADWIRIRRKAVDDIRRLEGHCLLRDECAACWELLERAAQLEARVLLVEAELEALLAEGPLR